jgi:methionine sulfoxide reductase heme-binding subunit
MTPQASRPGSGIAWLLPINRLLLHRAAQPLVFLLCLLPFVQLLLGAFGLLGQSLGANPAEALIRSTGDWTLRLLLLTLAITPVRVMTGWTALARWRRMLGLFTFFYAAWHFLAFAWLDMGFELEAILRDIAKRPFILVGTAALLLMTPLAATSFNAAIRRLGARRWQKLHQLVYAIAVLGLLHFFWMRTAKNLLGEVAIYAAVLLALLGWRVWRWWFQTGSQPRKPRAA